MHLVFVEESHKHECSRRNFYLVQEFPRNVCSRRHLYLTQEFLLPSLYQTSLVFVQEFSKKHVFHLVLAQEKYQHHCSIRNLYLMQDFPPHQWHDTSARRTYFWCKNPFFMTVPDNIDICHKECSSLWLFWTARIPHLNDMTLPDVKWRNVLAFGAITLTGNNVSNGTCF